MSKFNAGDLVTVRLETGNVDGFAMGDLVHVVGRITKHEPAPFSWEDAKPGQGFIYKNDAVVIGVPFNYVGKDLNGVRIFQSIRNDTLHRDLNTENLLPFPKYDIEVKP